MKTMKNKKTILFCAAVILLGSSILRADILELLKKYGFDETKPISPVAFAYDIKGNKYILDIDNRVKVYDSNENFRFMFAGTGDAAGKFVNAQRITVDKDENIYVSDTGNHRIQKFDNMGNFLHMFGGNSLITETGKTPIIDADNLNLFYRLNGESAVQTAIQDGELLFPEGIDVDDSGDIYVVDMNNARIQKFSPEGNFIRKWDVTIVRGNAKETIEPAPAPSAEVAIALSEINVAFKLGEVYSFPNPARRTNPTIHIECGVADEVEIRIYNTAAELVHAAQVSGIPPVINGRYAYEYTWDVSSAASGVYIYHIRAVKGGEELTALKKLAVLR